MARGPPARYRCPSRTSPLLRGRDLHPRGGDLSQATQPVSSRAETSPGALSPGPSLPPGQGFRDAPRPQLGKNNSPERVSSTRQDTWEAAGGALGQRVPSPLLPEPDGEWKEGFVCSWQHPLRNVRSGGVPGTADVEASGSQSRGLTWDLPLTSAGFRSTSASSLPPSLPFGVFPLGALRGGSLGGA